VSNKKKGNEFAISDVELESVMLQGWGHDSSKLTSPDILRGVDNDDPDPGRSTPLEPSPSLVLDLGPFLNMDGVRAVDPLTDDGCGTRHGHFESESISWEVHQRWEVAVNHRNSFLRIQSSTQHASQYSKTFHVNVLVPATSVTHLPVLSPQTNNMLSLAFAREQWSIGVDDAVGAFSGRVGKTGFHVTDVVVDVVAGDLFVFGRAAHDCSTFEGLNVACPNSESV
jgi:hypothetical protein